MIGLLGAYANSDPVGARVHAIQRAAPGVERVKTGTDLGEFKLPPGRIALRLLARAYSRLCAIGLKSANLSEVTNYLAVGGAFGTKQVAELKARGVTAVVDCRKEARDDERFLAESGIRFLHLPAPDRHAPTHEQLAAGVRWALEHLANGGRIFVHCEHGIGRGPLLGSAILIARGKSAYEAVQMIRAARWQALPNNRQLRALLNFETVWTEPRQSASSP